MRTTTYRSWDSMRNRCFTTTSKDYKNYGGRGISVCSRWDDYATFLADMGERPAGTSLGRINNQLGYFKANCRWESPTEQANNRRSSHILEVAGKAMTLSEWSRETGINKYVLYQRTVSGWLPEKIISTPVRPKQKES